MHEEMEKKKQGPVVGFMTKPNPKKEQKKKNNSDSSGPPLFLLFPMLLRHATGKYSLKNKFLYIFFHFLEEKKN
jgi:hypothetical protein